MRQWHWGLKSGRLWQPRFGSLSSCFPGWKAPQRSLQPSCFPEAEADQGSKTGLMVAPEAPPAAMLADAASLSGLWDVIRRYI